jgi:hypothetical protein
MRKGPAIMQNNEAQNELAAAGNSVIMYKRIGSIVFEVEIHFDPDARENMNDKRIRLIRRDLEAAS